MRSYETVTQIQSRVPVGVRSGAGCGRLHRPHHAAKGRSRGGAGPRAADDGERHGGEQLHRHADPAAAGKPDEVRLFAAA